MMLYSLAIVISIALLVLVQGGFFAGVCCSVGLVAAILSGVRWLRPKSRPRAVPFVALGFVLVALFYVASALANGLSLTTTSAAGMWVGCAAFALLASSLDEGEYMRMLRLLGWFGIATAGLGILVCVSLLHIEGGLVGDRLQFTFQYANAAAAWYGAISFVALLSDNDTMRSLSFLPVCALLLTQSAGAVLVFVVVAGLLGIVLCRSQAWEVVACCMFMGLLGVALFAFVHLLAPVGVVLAVTAGFFSVRFRQPLTSRFVGENARKACVAMLVCAGASLVAAFVLSPARVAGAMASLGERGVQVRDGLRLWTASPFFGVGPDNWRYLYPYVQSDFYRAAVNHSSWVGLLLDSGICGTAAFLATVVVGMKSLAVVVREQAEHRALVGKYGAAFGHQTLSVVGACLMILLHSLFEFDLRFGSLAFLLAALLSGAAHAPGLWKREMLAGALSLVTGLGTCFALFAVISSVSMTLANARGDYQTTQSLFASNPLARGDVEAQGAYLYALYATGRVDEASEVYEQMRAPQDQDVIFCSLSRYQVGRDSEATTVLIEHMEAQPFNIEFIHTAKKLFDTYGIDESMVGRYNAALDVTNGLIDKSEHAPTDRVDEYIGV